MSIKLIGDTTVPVTHLGMYSDNTPMIKLGDDVRADSFHTMVVKPNSLNEFVAAMFLVDSIHMQGGWIRHLVLPYVPGARQDRINRTGDWLYTAWSIADMINSRNFGKVSILDPHSDVIYKYIKRIHVFPLSKVVENLDGSYYSGIIAPDKGAGERAGEVATAMGLDVFYASKTRDVSTGKLSGFSVSLPQGHYLVVDDICDGGGTFVGLGEKIVEQGATADLYVTHGIFAKGVEGLRKFYKNIYTTDSLQKNHAVVVVPVVERMINND